jgi:prephenate dehydratase
MIFELKSITAALYKSLGGLASNGVNMTKIESYIDPQSFDVVRFYADVEGHPENENMKQALEEMKYYCKRIDILGVYKMSDFRKK